MRRRSFARFGVEVKLLRGFVEGVDVLPTDDVLLRPLAEPPLGPQEHALGVDAAEPTARAHAHRHEPHLPGDGAELEVVDAHHAVALDVDDLLVQDRGVEQHFARLDLARDELIGRQVEGDDFGGDAAHHAPREHHLLPCGRAGCRTSLVTSGKASPRRTAISRTRPTIFPSRSSTPMRSTLLR